MFITKDYTSSKFQVPMFIRDDNMLRMCKDSQTFGALFWFILDTCMFCSYS